MNLILKIILVVYYELMHVKFVIDLFILLYLAITGQIKEFIIYYLVTGVILDIFFIILTWPPRFNKLDLDLLYALLWPAVTLYMIILRVNKRRSAKKYPLLNEFEAEYEKKYAPPTKNIEAETVEPSGQKEDWN